LADSSAAVRRAIAIVCSSSDSRTPRRRPSMIGRTPILGKELVIVPIFPPFEPVSSLLTARGCAGRIARGAAPPSGFARRRQIANSM
jgi:hypothetical protein